MTVCAVNGCHSTSEKHKKHCEITFHVFPSDPIIAARWTEIIRLNRNESSWKPTKNTKLCSLHFDDQEKYVTKGGLYRLCKGAIPTKDLLVFSMKENLHSNDLLNDVLQNSQEQNRPQPDLFVFSMKENLYSNDLPNDVLQNSQEQNGPQPSSSGCDTNINANPRSPTTSLSSGLAYIYDSPEEASLRKQLRKKTLLLKKYSRKIKTLAQNNRRLKKRNAKMKSILEGLRKKRSINND